ncbi:MAG: hypothetical protein J7L54_05835, partial [Elusimicrobia bacterium]|nr:hypothetical protein [Elusimicrobiota bacterium]
MIKKNLKQNQMLRERGLLRIFLFLFTANFLFASHIEEAKKLFEEVSKLKKQTLNEFELAIKENPTDEVFLLKAKFLFENGKYGEMLETLGSIKATNYETEKLNALGNYFLGRLTRAIYYFSRISAEAERKRDFEVLYYYGRVQEDKNLFEEAIKTYEKIAAGNFFEKARERISNLQKNIPLKLKDLPVEIVKIVADAPSQKDYPQAGAAVLLEKEDYEVFSDSTSVSEITKAIKIFNDRGKRKFAEVHLSYDSTYES